MRGYGSSYVKCSNSCMNASVSVDWDVWVLVYKCSLGCVGASVQVLGYVGVRVPM